MRVDSLSDEHKVLCPKCGKMLTVPPVSVKKVDLASWKLRSIDGQMYGPYSEAEVGQLIAELRIISTSELNHPRFTGSTWKQAKDLPQFNKLFLSQVSQAAVEKTETPADPSSSVSQKEKPKDRLDGVTSQVNKAIKTAGTLTRPQIVVYSFCGFALTMLVLIFAGQIVLSIEESKDSNSSLAGLIYAPIIAIFQTLVITFGAVVYLMPTIVAFLRHHKNLIPILIVDVFFGWTFVGWVLSLAWSFSADGAPTPIPPPAQIHTHVYTHAPEDSSASVS